MKPINKIGIAAVLAVAALVGFRLAESHSFKETPKPSAFPSTAIDMSLPTPVPGVVAETKPTPAPGQSQPPEVRITFTQRLGHDIESLQFASVFRHHPEIVLSQEQFDKLLDAYIETCSQRIAYETSISTMEVISPNENKVTIPAYKEEGLRLQSELYLKFAALVGGTQAEQVKQAIQAELYFKNFGFGEAPQTIDVVLKDRKIGEEYQIYYDVIHSQEKIQAQVMGPQGHLVMASMVSKGLGSSFPLADPGIYRGLIKFLPKGGS